MDLKVASWTKAELETWLGYFVTYYNALRSFVNNGEAAVKNLAEEALSKYSADL
jgi:hypothetical protein